MACNQCYRTNIEISSTHNTRQTGYFPIVLMKLVAINLFEIDMNIDCSICEMYFFWSGLLMLHFLQNCR